MVLRPCPVTLLLISFVCHVHAQRCLDAFQLAIGSYTSQPWLPTASGQGVSIFSYSSNQLRLFSLLSPSIVSTNPSYLAADSQFLYAANENAHATATRISSLSRPPFISSLSVRLNASAATHIAKLAPNLLAVANFDGDVSILTSDAEGVRFVRNYYVPRQFASARRNPSLAAKFWQFDSPHPHMVLPYREGLLVPDLGSDMLLYLTLERQTARLSLESTVLFEAGDGPRHAALHPQSSTVYVVNEVSLSVVALRFNRCGRGLSVCQRRNLYAQPVGEGASAAAIRVTDDGRFLYVSVRFPDTQLGNIVGYRLDARSGDIQARIGIWSSFGVHPRDLFVIEKALYRQACVSFVAIVNRDTDNLVLVERDRGSGMLRSYVALSANVTTPTSVLQI